MSENPEGHSPRYWRKHPEAESRNFAVESEMPVAMRSFPLLHGWFTLSPPEDRKKSKEIKQIIFDVGLAVLFGVVPMPVAIRWTGWLLCFVGLAYFIVSSFGVGRLPAKSRVVLVLIMVIAFVIAFRTTCVAQWKEEKAGEPEGNLVLDNAHATLRLLQIGNSQGGWLNIATADGLPGFQLFNDAQIAVDNEDGHLLLSTFVRDRQGKWIVKLDRNHWSVNPDRAICMDKNYTKDALEVLDGRGHVVLQARLYPDHVQLQGIWFDDSGERIELYSHNGAPALFRSRKPDPESEVMLKPIFQYPSSQHWAEWATAGRKK